VNRRAFTLALLLVPGLARAQSTATSLQIDLALAHASLVALRTRYGDGHAEITLARGRIASVAASLREALARGDTIDTAAAGQALEVELADVRTRLAGFSSRCGSGHPDMEAARAREAALADALAHVTSDGVFFPP
jgi:uncharacterized protein involved in exopolysaccharide biosynthesis